MMSMLFMAVPFGLLTLQDAEKVPDVTCFWLSRPEGIIYDIDNVALSILVMGNCH